MHAANKMPSRMEEAIDCVKRFQYNHQIFQIKKSIHMVGESHSYDFPDSHAWSTSLHDPPLLETRSRQRERYVSYKGQNSPSAEKSEEKKETPTKAGKEIEERMVGLEGMFQQLLQKLDGAMEKRFSSNRSPSPSRLSAASGRAESPSRCFYCNSEGHFKRDCPKRRHVSFKKVDTADLNNSGSDLEA